MNHEFEQEENLTLIEESELKVKSMYMLTNDYHGCVHVRHPLSYRYFLSMDVTHGLKDHPSFFSKDDTFIHG